MGSGGGGTSGEVKYPDYIEAKHVYALNDAYNDVSWAKSSNPYSGKSAYDPSLMHSKIQESVDDLDGLQISSAGSNVIQSIMDNVTARLYKWGGAGYDGLFAADDWSWYWNLVDDFLIPDFITTL